MIQRGDHWMIFFLFLLHKTLQFCWFFYPFFFNPTIWIFLVKYFLGCQESWILNLECGTPSPACFFIFVRTREKYFLCDFYWGPNSKIYKVAKTSVKGFLGKCLKLYKKGDTIEFSRTKHRWHYLHNINLHFIQSTPPPPLY